MVVEKLVSPQQKLTCVDGVQHVCRFSRPLECSQLSRAVQVSDAERSKAVGTERARCRAKGSGTSVQTA